MQRFEKIETNFSFKGARPKKRPKNLTIKKIRTKIFIIEYFPKNSSKIFHAPFYPILIHSTSYVIFLLHKGPKILKKNNESKNYFR